MLKNCQNAEFVARMLKIDRHSLLLQPRKIDCSTLFKVVGNTKVKHF